MTAAVVIEANRAATRRIHDEVINQAKYEVAGELFAGEVVGNERSRGDRNLHSRGVDGMVELFTTLRAAFPDHHIEVEDLIAENDRVVARVTTTGTHSGEFLGVEATGMRIQYSGIDIFRFEDGKCVEHCGATDMLGFLTQVGAWTSRK